MKNAGLVATRRSLVDRLVDWDDRKHWQEFFDTYWKLIYSAARKSGLTDAEAQEVVQETVITVAKKIDKLKYDPAIGSFKGWLLQITRWRIVDQFRKREPGNAKRPRVGDDRLTATIERVPDSRVVSDFRLLRAQGVAGPKSGGSITSQHRAGLSRATSGLGGLEKRDQSAGEERSLGSTSPSGERTAFKPVLSPFFVLKAV